MTREQWKSTYDTQYRFSDHLGSNRHFRSLVRHCVQSESIPLVAITPDTSQSRAASPLRQQQPRDTPLPPLSASTSPVSVRRVSISVSQHRQVSPSEIDHSPTAQQASSPSSRQHEPRSPSIRSSNQRSSSPEVQSAREPSPPQRPIGFVESLRKLRKPNDEPASQQNQSSNRSFGSSLSQHLQRLRQAKLPPLLRGSPRSKESSMMKSGAVQPAASSTTPDPSAHPTSSESMSSPRPAIRRPVSTLSISLSSSELPDEVVQSPSVHHHQRSHIPNQSAGGDRANRSMASMPVTPRSITQQHYSTQSKRSASVRSRVDDNGLPSYLEALRHRLEKRLPLETLMKCYELLQNGLPSSDDPLDEKLQRQVRTMLGDSKSLEELEELVRLELSLLE